MADVAAFILFVMVLVVVFLVMIVITKDVIWDGIKGKEYAEVVLGLFSIIICCFAIGLTLHTIMNNAHICSNCGDFSFGDTYCEECGQQLIFAEEELRCPQCDKVNGCGAHYCYNCGTSLENVKEIVAK